MARRNPLMALALLALDQAQSEGRPRTTDALREIMDGDVDAQYSAMDIAVARKRLQGQAIRQVLRAHGPAYKSADGFPHVDGTADLPVATLERIVTFRENVAAVATGSVAEWRDRLAHARLREGLDAGVPAPETAPESESASV